MAVGFTISDRNDPPTSGFTVQQRTPASKATSCRVRVWHYRNQNFGTASNVRDEQDISEVMEVHTFDIVNEIASIDINKNIENPSATFSISLLPSENWKERISPGDWIAIFMYSTYEANYNRINDTTNLVLIGNIDRISRIATKDEETDKLVLRFNVQGRNFGKVFETTDIWYDPYQRQAPVIDVILRQAGLEIQGDSSKHIKAILDVFLGPGGDNTSIVFPVTKDEAFEDSGVAGTRTSPLKQWRIPQEVAFFLGTTGPKTLSDGNVFYDVLRKDQITENLPGIKLRNMINVDDNGMVWDFLEQSHNYMVNELFLEEVRDGNGAAYPHIILRPKPLQTVFFEEQFGDDINLLDQLNGHYKKFLVHSYESFVEISQSEILFENIGKDDLSRFNHFYMKTKTSFDHYRSNSTLDIRNPFINRESIQRHGLKRFEQVLEFITPALNRQNQIEIELFQAFLTQIYDLHFANHLYESGTIECTGILEAELGKALIVISDEEVPKIYYIEGYEHQWRFPNTWRTIFTVSHGQYQASTLPFIDVEGYGLPDTLVDSTYVAKTRLRKDVNENPYPDPGNI